MKIVIWQGHKIEKIIKDNPALVYRFFPSSLTLKGRFKVIDTRFFSYLQLPSGTDLIDIWENKENLEFSPEVILPIVIAEAKFGDIFERQWGFWFKKDVFLEALLFGLTNILQLLAKCEEMGKNSYFMMLGMEYLLLSNLIYIPAETITEEIVDNVLESLIINHKENIEKSYYLLNKILEPIISNVCYKISETCCNNSLCRKSMLNIFARNKFINQYIPKASIEDSITKKVMMIAAPGDKCRYQTTSVGGICPLIDISNNLIISDKDSLLKTLKVLQDIFTQLRDTIFGLS